MVFYPVTFIILNKILIGQKLGRKYRQDNENSG